MAYNALPLAPAQSDGMSIDGAGADRAIIASFASDAMKFRSMTQHVMQFFSSSSEFTATWATPSPRAVDLIRSIFRSSSSVRGRKTHSICAIFLLPLPRHQPAENNSIKRPEIEVNFNFDEAKEEVELFAI